MTLIAPEPYLLYTGSPLDRVVSLRKNVDFVLNQLANPHACIIILWRGQHLLLHIDSSEMALYLPQRHEISLTNEHIQTRPWALLGIKDKTVYLAIDVSEMDNPYSFFAPPHCRFGNIRYRAVFLPPEHAALAAHSRAMLHWLTTHKFCGQCGGKNLNHEGGYKLVCSHNPEHQHFPRTDPAVLMLIEHDDYCLLAQPAQPSASTKRFSTLAGFVEPGEQLEEAVQRETFEETGLRLKKISYFTSQPWPYPYSLIIGFTALATSSDIILDHAELTHAEWFDPSTLMERLNNDPQAFPSKHSLSRRMIDEWIFRKTSST